MPAPRPADEEERLEALRRSGLLEAPAVPGFEDLPGLAARLCGAPMAGLGLVDRDRVWYPLRVGMEQEQVARDGAFCAWAILGSEPMVVPDAEGDPRFGPGEARFYAGAPLCSAEGQNLGTLWVMDRLPRRLGLAEQESLAALARQAAALLALRREAAAAARAADGPPRANERAEESEARLRAVAGLAAENPLGIDRQLGGSGPDVPLARRVDTLKNEFVSIVSHELRTPLTAIRGALGLLESEALGPLPAQSRELVGIARSNSDRLIRLVNDILDLEKIEAGRMELRPRRLTARELIDTAVAGLAPLALGARVRLETGPAPGRLTGDRDRLIQVLTNLLSNAIKFSPEGAPIRVEAKRLAGGRLRFSVGDRGPGIPPESLRRLFARFEQLDSSDHRVQGGSGLGLAISKAIIEQHGGRIGVDSRPGEGSTFWFELEGTPCDRRGVCACRLAAGGPEASPRVLLVEPRPDRAEALGRMLADGGFLVVRAATLAEAETELGLALPAVIVLGETGVGGETEAGASVEPADPVARLRRLPGACEVPVLARGGTGVSGPGVERVDGADGAVLAAVRRAARRPGPARVLVVVDDPGQRERLAAGLRALGAECVGVSEGLAAVRRARTLSPDLVVVERAEPSPGACDLVELLAEGGGRVIPLLLLSDDPVRGRWVEQGRGRWLRRTGLRPGAVGEAAKGLLAAAGFQPGDDDEDDSAARRRR